MNATLTLSADLHLAREYADAAGYTRREYLAGGADYYIGQPWATVWQTAAGWCLLFGRREGAGWSGGIESVVSYRCTGRIYKTEAAALRRARAWFEEETAAVARNRAVMSAR